VHFFSWLLDLFAALFAIFIPNGFNFSWQKTTTGVKAF